ncbi:hypothetical protein EXS71_00310 [Candidatus Uhrbacteria bacterium]|nr:hypothetical protein [Candidatus Uhrbacteria bacterium]
MNKQAPREALQWITDILLQHKIPFQITGGLAGIVYGSGRSLNDIDIDVPEDRMQEIVSDVKKYIEFGPERYKDENWDLMVLTLNYKGQSIDLGGTDTTKTFDKNHKQWFLAPCNLSSAQIHDVLGTPLPVVHPKDYIIYKRSLNRTIHGEAIDQIDAVAAENFLRSQ